MKILKSTLSLISLLCFLFLGQNALSYPYYYFENPNLKIYKNYSYFFFQVRGVLKIKLIKQTY